jgi:hypothetical protein
MTSTKSIKQQQVLISALIGWGVLMNIALPVFGSGIKEHRQNSTYQRVDQFEMLEGNNAQWRLYNNLDSRQSEYYVAGKIKWRYNARTGIRLKYICNSDYLCEVTTNENGIDVVTEERQYDPNEINEPQQLTQEIR